MAAKHVWARNALWLTMTAQVLRCSVCIDQCFHKSSMKFPFLSIEFPVNFPCHNHKNSLQISFLFGDFSGAMVQAAHQQLVL
jgi:hypothetical protein